MKSIKENMCVYSLGAVTYCMIEVLFRGFTHWTMGIAGGLALLGIYKGEGKLKKKYNIVKRCVFGAFYITAIEFAIGIIVNKIFKMNVWDYSGRPMNVLGQICPVFSFFWFLLCFPACFICKGLRKAFKRR